MTHTVLKHEETGLLYHAESGDDAIFKERRFYDCVETRPDDVLLDVGAHVGIMSAMFLAQGIHYAVSVEPTPMHADLLRQNLTQFGERSIIIEGAVRLTQDEPTLLYLDHGRNLCTNRVVPTKGRDTLPVASYALADLLERYNPSILKIDIEGGEYELAPVIAALPSHVRYLLMELHLNLKDWRQLAPPLVSSVVAQGFTAVRAPNIGDKNWGTVAVWQHA